MSVKDLADQILHKNKVKFIPRRYSMSAGIGEAPETKVETIVLPPESWVIIEKKGVIGERRRAMIMCPKGHKLAVIAELRRLVRVSPEAPPATRDIVCPVDGTKIKITMPGYGYDVVKVSPGPQIELPPPVTPETIVLPPVEKTVTVTCPKGHKLTVTLKRERREIPKGLMISPPSPYMDIKCPICGETVTISHPGMYFRVMKIIPVTPEVKPPEIPTVAAEVSPWRKYIPYVIIGSLVTVAGIGIAVAKKKKRR